MDSLTKCLLPFWYKPPNQEAGNEVEFLIDLPTVRQAILLYGIIPYFENKSYEARIRLVMREWLGGSGLLSYLDDNEIKWETQVMLVHKLIKSCEPEMGEKKEDGENNVWGRDESLEFLIAEYRYWFKSDVMNEPWPFFLNQAQNLGKLKGEAGLAELAWYAAGKSTEAFEALMKKAGYKKGKGVDVSFSAEDKKMQMQNAMALAGLIGKRDSVGKA